MSTISVVPIAIEQPGTTGDKLEARTSISDDDSDTDSIHITQEALSGVVDDRSASLANCVSRSVIAWLEKEVKKDLVAISRKLDNFAPLCEKAEQQARKSKPLEPPSARLFREEACEIPESNTSINSRAVMFKEDVSPDPSPSNSFTGNDANKPSGRAESCFSNESVLFTDSSDRRLVSHFSSGTVKSVESVIAQALTRFSKESSGTKDTILRRHRFVSAWHFMEDPESSDLAKVYAHIMQTIIVVSVILPLLQTVDPAPLHGWGAAILELTFDTLFGLEFILRFTFCPNKATFIFHWLDVVDLVAAMIIVPRVWAGFNLDDVESSFGRTFLLCFVPIIRMCKTLRRFQNLHLVVKAFQATLEALPVLLWTLVVAVLFFSTAIYLCEPRDNIESLPKAMWLTIVTMTTVGYGDVAPQSASGALVTSVVIVLSLLYLAMPIGIIGETFGEIWKDRDKILLVHQTRKKLLQWGYQAVDIPVIFALFDKDGGSEIELPEFRSMMREMGIGLAEERVISLFESLDCDGSGGIDDREFVRQMFPECFHKLYCMDTSPERMSRRGSRLSGYVPVTDPRESLTKTQALSIAARKSFAVRIANAEPALNPTSSLNLKKTCVKNPKLEVPESHRAWA